MKIIIDAQGNLTLQSNSADDLARFQEILRKLKQNPALKQVEVGEVENHKLLNEEEHAKSHKHTLA